MSPTKPEMLLITPSRAYCGWWFLSSSIRALARVRVCVRVGCASESAFECVRGWMDGWMDVRVDACVLVSVSE